MTPGKGLFFQRTTKKEIEIFSDADWAGSVTDRRSTSGYCLFVWGNLVTWRSKKQLVVARSSAEAEFPCYGTRYLRGNLVEQAVRRITGSVEASHSVILRQPSRHQYR